MKEVIDLDGAVVQVPITTAVKTVNGIHYLLTDEEKAEAKARKDAWDAESTKRNALAEIARLESEITPRRTREAILGTDNGWLANQESLIATERNKLGE